MGAIDGGRDKRRHVSVTRVFTDLGSTKVLPKGQNAAFGVACCLCHYCTCGKSVGFPYL